ncbi:capsid maturation protease [Gordonia phage TinaLin]|uniref:Capsid maturation protease n=1 Tax=Gordonia phage TinaLin TaxID=2797324 RepID=A0A7T7GTD8_9CAUD|nr:head maturation protease [Gordonia phage TinaLin]QQM15101.1 capsid maturation protease [Gordonia phage TinaLin]
MKTKAIELAGVKAGPDDGLADGEFIGYASVFGNKDSYGDVVEPGAFTETLKAWDESGQLIPLYWAHNTSDPDYNVGHVVKAEQDEVGLKVHVKIDLDSPKGPQVYRLVKGRRVGQMSFMYEVEEGEYVTPIGSDGAKSYEDAYYSLKRLKVHEVSVVQVGANQSTEITAVKELADSLAAKAGRTLSSKNEDALRGAIGAVESALAELKSILPDEDADEDENDEDDDDASGKASAAVRSGDPEPAAAKTSPSVSVASARLKVLALKR